MPEKNAKIIQIKLILGLYNKNYNNNKSSKIMIF